MHRLVSNKWTKLVVFIICLAPLGTLVYRALQGLLGANPVEFLQHATGLWTLRFLIFTLAITPLRAFPVIRDLVTDVSFNYAKAREIPSFTPDPSVKPGEFRMQQVDVNRSQEFRKCIECFLCQDTCHVIRDHPANERPFAGPERTSNTCI